MYVVLVAAILFYTGLGADGTAADSAVSQLHTLRDTEEFLGCREQSVATTHKPDTEATSSSHTQPQVKVRRPWPLVHTVPDKPRVRIDCSA